MSDMLKLCEDAKVVYLDKIRCNILVGNENMIKTKTRIREEIISFL